MPVIVTFRHRKEVTLSKGASGPIKEIILADDDVSKDQTRGVVNLSQLPKTFILKLDHPPNGIIGGFAHGEIPVLPSTRRFGFIVTTTKLNAPIWTCSGILVHRLQVARTDNRSCRVDIGKPGTGHISQFNAYVAISRGRGPEN